MTGQWTGQEKGLDRTDSGQDKGQNRGQVVEIMVQKERKCPPVLYFKKYNANNIVRAGPAQPAQPDGMRHLCFRN